MEEPGQTIVGAIERSANKFGDMGRSEESASRKLTHDNHVVISEAKSRWFRRTAKPRPSRCWNWHGGLHIAIISLEDSLGSERLRPWGNIDMQTRQITDPNSANGLDRLASIFKGVDWVVPAYIPLGKLSMFGGMIEQAPQAQKQAVLERALRSIYDEPHFASFLLGLYERTRHVRDFKVQITEAIEAWHSGLHHAAVTVMVPVLEGIVRKIAREGQRDVGSGTRRVIAELDGLIAKEDRSPRRFEERIVMLTGLRDFFALRLLTHTDAYDGLDQLNRHGILHGMFEQYGKAVNFLRLITLLELICFAMALAHGGSSFAPNHTPESDSLAERYRKLRQAAD